MTKLNRKGELAIERENEIIIRSSRRKTRINKVIWLSDLSHLFS